MATILRKLKRILEGRLPPADTVDLRDDDGIIGVVTSRRVRRMDSMQRQDLIHDIPATSLKLDEWRHVGLIVGVTPERRSRTLEMKMRYGFGAEKRTAGM